jgi:hypothetical protein
VHRDKAAALALVRAALAEQIDLLDLHAAAAASGSRHTHTHTH